MVYSTQGGTTTESVTVQASRRRALSLTRDEVLDLGRMGLAIEEHYGQAMDIEWAKDGRTGDLFIVQARPETVHVHAKKNSLERYVLDPQASALRTSGRVLANGQAVGTRVGTGRVRLYRSYEEVILKKRALRTMLAGRPQPRGRAGRRARVRPRRRSRHRDDDARLGADDEGGFPHRDREGRTDVARRDHRARVRHPGDRRLRGRDQAA